MKCVAEKKVSKSRLLFDASSEFNTPMAGRCLADLRAHKRLFFSKPRRLGQGWVPVTGRQAGRQTPGTGALGHPAEEGAAGSLSILTIPSKKTPLQLAGDGEPNRR